MIRRATLAFFLLGCAPDEHDPSRRLTANVAQVVGLPAVHDETLLAGSTVAEGGTIRTPTRSAAHLKIGTRIDVVVDFGTRARLASLRAGGVRLVLRDGSLRVVVKSLPPGESISVEVAGGRVGTRDAVFRVAARDDGIRSVSVLSGEVAFGPAPDAPIVVAGETLRASAKEPIDEADARALAALVAGRPWVARPHP